MNQLTRLFSSERGRRGFLIRLAALVLTLLLAYLALRMYAPYLLDPYRLRNYVKSYGWLAPLVFVGLQVIQVVVSPIPGHGMGVVSGYLFGAFYGTLYSALGATIGSATAVWLSRRYGRPYVERVVDGETLRRFDSAVEDEGVTTLFLIFLVPGLPDDAVCFISGLTEIPLWKIVTIALIGRLPGLVIANLSGAGFAQNRVLEAVSLLVLLVVLGIVGYIKRREITGFLVRRAN